MREPPFYGEPCPCCPMTVRAFGAVVFNTLNDAVRYPDPAAFVREWHDFKRETDAVRTYEFSHPDLTALRDEAVRLVDLVTPDSQITVEELMNEFKHLYELEKRVQPLVDAHFADRRHSHG